jgi:hypothetical protein
MKHDVSVHLTGGKSLAFETGKLAKQAHGSVVVRIGESVVLATAVSNPDPREGIDFFPLTVDYREYTYARFLRADRLIVRFGRCFLRGSSARLRSLRLCFRRIRRMILMWLALMVPRLP